MLPRRSWTSNRGAFGSAVNKPGSRNERTAPVRYDRNVGVVLRYPGCTVDLSRALVTREGGAEPLTPLERDLLSCLARAAGRVVDKPTLLERVWGYHPDSSTRAMDSSVKRLRRKLERDPLQPEILLTVRGVGFQLAAPPSPERLGNLRPDPTSFVGRVDELARLQRLFDGGAQLVTVVGSGGMGKTRLARQHARASLAPEVWFCDVSGATTADALRVAIGRVVGLQPAASADDEPAAQMAEGLADRGHVFLVLDNLEQVVEHAASLLTVWLAGCPRLQVLATSREALRIVGEALLPLSPLKSEDAEALLVERVGRAGGALAADEDQRSAIVQRLECVPLAIELAAPRAARLPPTELLQRMDDRLGLLVRGPRDAPVRHRTLRASIDWSWELLDDRHRRAFARCGVFEGPFSLGAAEAVLGGPPGGVHGLVEELCDCSLLQVVAGAGRARFRLLQTVREYAVERLSGDAGRGATEARHAAHYVAAVERLVGFAGPQSPDASRQVAAASADLVAVVRRDSVDPDLRVRAAVALGRWFQLVGPVSLHAELLDLVLELPAGAGPLAVACRQRARIHGQQLERDRARQVLARGEGLLAQVEDPAPHILIGLMKGNVSMWDGDAKAARRLYREAVERAEGGGSRDLELMSRTNLSNTFHRDGDMVTALEASRETLARLQESRSPIGVKVRGNLGTGCTARGRFAEADEHMTRALADAEWLGDDFEIVMVLGNLAHLRRLQGRAVEAEALLRRCHELYRRVGRRQQAGHTLGLLGVVMADQGRRTEALEALHRGVQLAERTGAWRPLILHRKSLGLLHHDEGDLDAAAAAFDLAREHGAKFPSLLPGILGCVGRLAHERGRLDDALVAYETATAADGRGFVDLLPACGRAALLADLDRPDEAEAELGDVEQRACATARVWRSVARLAAGHVLEARARASVPDEAAALRDRALQVAVDDPTLGLEGRVALRMLRGRLGDRPVVAPVGPRLTGRERQVVSLVARDLSNRQIAEALGLGLGTVKTHLNNVRRKLEASSREQVVERAHRFGLLDA